MLHMTRRPTPLGPLTLACDGDALVAAWLEGQTPFGGKGPLGPAIVEERPEVPILKLAVTWLDAYFAGRRPAIADLPLAPAGSPFRQMVWKRLCAIPYGECVTYGELARELAAASHKAQMSAQAVGGAVGHNPVSLIIPCHRVMGAGGNLTGYAGGIEKKLWLLRWEGVETRHFFAPRRPSGKTDAMGGRVVMRKIQT